ncbi:hypothetical protein HRbin08_02192 [bacterium HR08]|nr:hypothetical protein HRbin08_02192 [bacterium HR08]
MLAPAKRRQRRHRPLDDLQQRLLHPLARDVARDRGALALARDLINLVNVDDAALGRLEVSVRRHDQPREDVLHILADIAGLGQRRRIRDGERDLEELRQRSRDERLPRPGRTDHEDVALLQFDIGLSLIEELQPAIMLIDREGDATLGVLLPDDVLIEERLDLRRTGQDPRLRLRARTLPRDDRIGRRIQGPDAAHAHGGIRPDAHEHRLRTTAQEAILSAPGHTVVTSNSAI